MSARQRARIADQSALLKNATAESVENGSVTESEDDVPAAPRFQFGSSSSSSESASDGEGSDDEAQTLSVEYRVASIPQARAEESAIAVDDLTFLDSAIADNSLTSPNARAGTRNSTIEVLEQVLFYFKDAGGLDIGSALRRRGEEGGPRHVEQQPRRGGRGLRRGPAPPPRTNVVAGKTYIFGQPSEDWLRPPSFSAGGFGMQRRSRDKHTAARARRAQPQIPAGDGTEWFSFSWSQDYEFLINQYDYIQETEDANLLVMFLTHFPYLHVGLVQLALIYASAGQLQKAVQLTRRALYGFECATLESMKPGGVGSARVHAVCRMDPSEDANADYFAALLVHMRLCSALGCPAVAAEVCRYQLWLCPQDSAHGLLLVLDHLLVAAGQDALMLQYCGADANAPARPAVASVLADAVAALPTAQHGFRSPYRFSAFESSSVPTADRALEHLPNWWFSLALSERLQSQRRIVTGQFATAGSAVGQDGTLPSPTQRLKCALLHWPFMLRPLLSKCDSADLSARGPWNAVMQHPLFTNAECRVSEDSYLSNISTVYAQLNGALWDKEDVLRWLLQSALELTQELSAAGPEAIGAVIAAQVAYYVELSIVTDANRQLATYAHVTADSLSSSFPPFPGGESPLDPSLDDPEYLLSGAVRFRDFVNAEGEFMFSVPAPYACTLRGRKADRRRANTDASSDSDPDSGDDVELPRNGAGVDRLLQMNWRRRGGWEGPDGAGGRPSAQSNIDFALPLMQLFIATLFPWIYVQPLPRV